MKEAGEVLAVSEEAFLASVGQAPRAINVARLMALEAEDFVDALWLSCFRRLPDPVQKESLKGQPKEEILRIAMREPAFAMRRLEYANCHCEISPVGTDTAKALAFTAAGEVKNSIMLRKIAKKLPAPLQNGIRRVFG